MDDFMITYIDQVNEINQLMQHLDLTGIPREEVISHIRERSARVYSLLQSNNTIVQEKIVPWLAPDYRLSHAEYESLNSFAEEICSMASYIDAALGFYIHEKLLSSAESVHNTDQIIEQQYKLGIASYLLYSEFEMFTTINVRQKVVPWFNNVAAYLNRFDKLSHTSRGYVLRSLNNEALIFNSKRYDQLDSYMQVIRHTLSVYTSEKIRAMEPDINWNAFVKAVYRNCLRISDSIESGYGLCYIPDVKAAANYLSSTSATAENASVIDQYSAIELSNILHKIDDEECMKKLNAIYAKRDPFLFNREGIDQNINIPSFSLLYEVKLEHPNVERINEKIENIITYVNAFHHQTGLYSYHYAIANLIRYYPDYNGITPFRHVLEQLQLALHVPTYVHSQMVSSIAVMIGDTLLADAPEVFIGLNQYASVEDVVNNSSKIHDFIRYAGLFHDVGKFYCMDVITQYSRKLFDNEFHIIRLHTECGYEILSKHPSTLPYAEIVLMHHITYDRSGGYAKEYMPDQEKYAIISDIIRIADAIDASTDNIGRCYSACKTQEEIMDELIHSPRSYNPDIIKLLAAPEQQKSLHYALNNVRNELYEKVYVDD